MRVRPLDSRERLIILPRSLSMKRSKYINF
jgi:hypothetical protein